MKRIILLVASAVFVAACADSQPNPTVSGDAANSGDFAVAQAPRTSRTSSEIAPWAAYREFNFDSSSVEIPVSEAPKLREIVAYVASDPSRDVGIDGTLGATGVSPAERDLNDRRIASVRRALMDTGAGVASYKIKMGPFGDPERRRPGQIQVLIGPRTGSPRDPL